MILTDLPLSPFDALLVIIVFALFSATCGKGLDSTTCTSHEDKLYCKACYGKAFGPKGYGFAGGAAGSPPTCRQVCSVQMIWYISTSLSVSVDA